MLKLTKNLRHMNTSMVYRYPPSAQSLNYTTCSWERPILLPVFTNFKDFHFYEKKVKRENSVQCLLYSSHYTGSEHPNSMWLHQAPSPETTLSTLSVGI